jgi:hypothetical protein
VDRIDGHHDDDGRGNERREQHAQRDGDDRRPPERRDGLGQPRMVDCPCVLGIGFGFERDALGGGPIARDRNIGAFAGRGDRVAGDRRSPAVPCRPTGQARRCSVCGGPDR